DNVGDNVGDCAGMAADVFETYAVSLIGAILVGALTLAAEPAAIIYPFLLGGISVLGAICGVFFVNIAGGKPAPVLMGAVITNALISAILFWPATHYLFPAGITISGMVRSPTQLYFASVIGLVMTAVVVAITNYYTSMRYRPVQKIAHASETGHATNIIAGLAVGQHATALPVGFIGLAILLTFHFAGLYGIAIAVMSMLSMAGIIISLDSFGPITDNAGGVAVMADLPREIRVVTNELDAVGNTMKAVTKGYAIASAGLAALVLFGSYVQELSGHVTARGGVFSYQFLLAEPEVIIALFIGGLLVGTIVTGLFIAIAMTSGGAAWDNAKKFIEEGNLGGKGSFAHAAAVTGDTVGDPYKDTAGPAINPMIKVVNIVAILIIPI